MDIRFRCNTYAHVCCDTCTFLLQHIYTCSLRLMYTYLFDVHMRRNKHFYVCCNEHVYVCCNEHACSVRLVYICVLQMFVRCAYVSQQTISCVLQRTCICVLQQTFLCVLQRTCVCVLQQTCTCVACSVRLIYTCALHMCVANVSTPMQQTATYMHTFVAYMSICTCVATNMYMCCNRHVYLLQQTFVCFAANCIFIAASNDHATARTCGT